MANIQFSGIGITAAAGKLGTEVYARNQHGPYVRSWVSPAQPASAFRDAQQQFLINVQAAWQALSPEIQESWNDHASLPAWRSKNKLGQLYSPSGRELFFKVNLTRDRTSSISSELPVKVALNDCRVLSFVHSGTGPGPAFNPILDLTWNANPTDPNQTLQLHFTSYLSTGISRPKPSYFKLLFNLASTFPFTSLDIGAQYVFRFGSYQTGKRIFVRSRVASRTSGDILSTAQVFLDT